MVATEVIDHELAVLLEQHGEALHAIFLELEHQRQKWGSDKQQSLPGFLLILESEMDEAKRGWTKNSEGRNSPLSEVVQVAAVALACLTRYGVSGSARATDDVTESRMREVRLADSERRWGAQ